MDAIIIPAAPHQRGICSKTNEASLNSRPLVVLSDDSMDTAALIPGHFLVHRALKQTVGTDQSNLIKNMQLDFRYR